MPFVGTAAPYLALLCTLAEHLLRPDLRATQPVEPPLCPAVVCAAAEPPVCPDVICNCTVAAAAWNASVGSGTGDLPTVEWAFWKSLFGGSAGQIGGVLVINALRWAISSVRRIFGRYGGQEVQDYPGGRVPRRAGGYLE